MGRLRDAIAEMIGLIDQQKRLLNSDAKLGDLSVSAINDYRDRSERISELSQELETTLSSRDAADPISPPERKPAKAS
jgi:hypothetical protein